MQRNRLILMLLGAMVAWGALLFIQRQPQLPPPAKPAGRSEGTEQVSGPGSSTHVKEQAPAQIRADEKLGPGSATAEPAPEARAKRDALRARIAQALEKNRAARDAPPAPPSAKDDDPDRPGTLIDRVGGREALVGHLNKDFIPLARECIDQAQERAPHLRGMLALGVEVIADPDLGAVVDVAKAAPENEVHEPGLLECIRESALSVTFPPSIVRGRELFMLTLRVTPEGPAAQTP